MKVNKCYLMLMFMVSIFSISQLYASELSWIKWGSNMSQDISGMVALSENEFLIVHDNKGPNEPRLGIIKMYSRDSLSYSPLAWPEGQKAPRDFESICRFPDNKNEFLMVNSFREGIYFTLNENRSQIIIKKQFKVPVPFAQKANIEGFSVWKQNGEWYAAWADRGRNKYPGILIWAKLDLESEKDVFGSMNSTTIEVPYPTLDRVRHISDIRVDSKGYLYITSASKGSNDGPFDSAFYFAGKFTSKNKTLIFNHVGELVPLYRTPGYKIEAFDMVPGPNGGLCFATDNEKEGSFLYISWIN